MTDMLRAVPRSHPAGRVQGSKFDTWAGCIPGPPVARKALTDAPWRCVCELLKVLVCGDMLYQFAPASALSSGRRECNERAGDWNLEVTVSDL